MCNETRKCDRKLSSRESVSLTKSYLDRIWDVFSDFIWNMLRDLRIYRKVEKIENSELFEKI